MKITVTYHSVDGVRTRRFFKTLKGAQTFAHCLVGVHPDIGRDYAVSFDGIGKVTVRGITLNELFPQE